MQHVMDYRRIRYKQNREFLTTFLEFRIPTQSLANLVNNRNGKITLMLLK